MYVSTDIPPAAVQLASGYLAPGESGRAMCNWNLILPNPGLGTFIVTNSSLWLFAFQQHRGNLRVTSAQQFPLRDLQYVGESWKAGRLLGDRVTLELKWPNGIDFRMVSRRPAEARVFIDAVRRGQHEIGGTHEDSAAALAILAELRDRGLLDAGEWDRAKGLLLGKPTNERDEAVGLLQQLHGLMQAGVISPGEFNMKKWQILSRN